ncbi:HAMP domain-containing histidine kinase [Paucibacter sp. DJ1R-11]|uniref:HAMP domain-containing sensor histidine kinase n=1 Tax=Paucibacter sp. DJ1R-11 TaxID=2893556 RepID=UPI0021E4D328|nr:HAMP domain-containing sensor histidine kinase [Paucibacter sp. DJ1R-11]MCV2364099.1 HAMP domain-containing histidine kinase [Paucibacter sp. DJ1R-11]
MRSLYLRIYLTLVVVLLAFAFGSAWLFQRHFEQERGSFESSANERMLALAELIHGSLPPASAPRSEQAEALQEWGQRLHMAIALVDERGERIAASEEFSEREGMPGPASLRVPLEDHRSLLVMRGGFRMGPGARMGGGPGPDRPFFKRGDNAPLAWGLPFFGPRPNGQILLVLLVLLFFGVALGAYPVVRRLTRRLESLKAGVEQFGSGQLTQRVDDSGSDEVAALAGSFNRAAAQIETLLRSQQSLLANASHELRSPLARLKMAFSMLDNAGPEQRVRLQAEIHTNISELDALVEEVLLASRLEAAARAATPALHEFKVDLMGLAAEEAARSAADFQPAAGLTELVVPGDERLLRRALRNLLENGKRYGGQELLLELARDSEGQAELRISDRGPGVPEVMRERIFEAFFRLPGHAEQAGGVGLGLSLVKQIALRHQGQVRCEARPGGGSVFVFSLPTEAN